MAEPATKPTRRSLAAAAEELGATPVAPEPEPEEVPTDEPTPELMTDAVHIKGVFDGFECTYVAVLPVETMSVELAALTAVLRAMGFSPSAPRPPQAPSGGSQGSQNGQPPPNGGGNRGGGGYGGGGGYRGGQQRQGGGGWGGNRGGGQQSQPANVTWEDVQGWHHCDHDLNYVKVNKFGSLECGYSSRDWFENSREYNGRNGLTFYCTSKEYQGR